MANGEEDLKEKNRDRQEEQAVQKKSTKQYAAWKVFQGREDAEMLQEKSSGWSAMKNNRGDYDNEDE